MSSAATPGTRSMRVRTSWSIRWRSLTGSRSDATPRIRIGKLARSNLRSAGRSASSGRLGTTRSMRSRMSAAAASRLVPHVNVTRMRLLPSTDVEVISCTPGTALSASSSGREIISSTSSGLASAHSVETLSVGHVTSGIRSTGTRMNATAPSRMTISVIITVPIGRRTQTEDRLIDGPPANPTRCRCRLSSRRVCRRRRPLSPRRRPAIDDGRA